jgi:hypothetical protein
LLSESALFKGPERTGRPALNPETRVFWRHLQMWKICQAPDLNSKVMTPDLEPLTSQTTKRYLACFISRLGILRIGAINKNAAQQAAFSISRERRNRCAATTTTSLAGPKTHHWRPARPADSVCPPHSVPCDSCVRMHHSYARVTHSCASTRHSYSRMHHSYAPAI